MPDPSQLTGQKQDAAIWEGLSEFSHLPDWLAEARDPALVGSALERKIPEFATGRLTLRNCDTGHFRFKNDFWTGSYELTITDPDKSEPRIIQLAGKILSPNSRAMVRERIAGALGTEEFHAIIPELNLELQTEKGETVLSALSMLTDPEEARVFLTQAIQSGSLRYHDLQIQACHPKVVRYQPGSRCTIVYQLEYPDGSGERNQWPEVVVVKTYRGDKGQNAYDSMAALWNSPLGSSPAVTVAEPLAYDPQLQALIQGPIREDCTLKTLLENAFSSEDAPVWTEAEEMLRKTAVGLAELHQSGVSMGRSWTWEDELADVSRWMERLSVPLPELAAALDPLVERLKNLAAATPADATIPAHGTFRPAQVLIHQGKIGFIDFDSFCQSEPSMDLALFLAAVRNIGMASTPKALQYQPDWALKRIDSLCETFLAEYDHQRPFSRQRLALWETLDIFTSVIHCWTKIKIDELSDALLLLDHSLKQNGIVRRA
jgi:hypothetical protein